MSKVTCGQVRSSHRGVSKNAKITAHQSTGERKNALSPP